LNTFDLAIAYKWIYDKEFTELIEKRFHENGLSTFIIGTHNVFEITNQLEKGDLSFKAILDRGSDEDESFQGIADFIQTTDTYVINGYNETEEAIDKAKMHKQLERFNFPVVDSIIVPSLDEKKELEITSDQLEKLGSPFIVKPSYYSGGAEGVLVNATSLDDILKSRTINSDDALLVQKKIYPASYSGRRIWLRVFWFFDEAIPLWWHDETHIYDEITEKEYNDLNIQQMLDLSKQIAEIAKLQYFSTEYTIDKNGDLYIIDYVNDQCDMRMKSNHFDGVPDWLAERLIYKMVQKVKSL
jgi:hypothetical protein